jgi:hypothetical protein
MVISRIGKARFLTLTAMVSIALTVAGCSGSSAPSDAQARAAYPWYEGMGEPVDFRKVNGESITKDGQKHYVYHFQQANPLKEKMKWFKCTKLSVYFSDSAPIGCEAMTGQQADGLMVSKGTITFKSTEQGWIPASGRIKSWGYCESLKDVSECYEKAVVEDTQQLNFYKGQRSY